MKSVEVITRNGAIKIVNRLKEPNIHLYESELKKLLEIFYVGRWNKNYTGDIFEELLNLKTKYSNSKEYPHKVVDYVYNCVNLRIADNSCYIDK